MACREGDEGLKPATVEKIRVVFGRSFELARQWAIPGGEINPVRGLPGRSSTTRVSDI